MNHHEGTVPTPAGKSDLCPSCGGRQPINAVGRFRRHPAATPAGEDPTGACWASGLTRAQVELHETTEAGSAHESLETKQEMEQ